MNNNVINEVKEYFIDNKKIEIKENFELQIWPQKIAIIAPVSGKYSKIGRSLINGIEMSIENLNKVGISIQTKIIMRYKLITSISLCFIFFIGCRPVEKVGPDICPSDDFSLTSDKLEIFPKDTNSDPNKTLSSAYEMSKLGINIVNNIRGSNFIVSLFRF